MTPDLPTGRDALVSITNFRDGILGTTDLLVLHFISVNGPERKVSSDPDIKFFDVEKLEDGLYRLAFALDEMKVWSIKFRGFGFYCHDYYPKRAVQ